MMGSYSYKEWPQGSPDPGIVFDESKSREDDEKEAQKNAEKEKAEEAKEFTEELEGYMHQRVASRPESGISTLKALRQHRALPGESVGDEESALKRVEQSRIARELADFDKGIRFDNTHVE